MGRNKCSFNRVAWAGLSEPGDQEERPFRQEADSAWCLCGTAKRNGGWRDKQLKGCGGGEVRPTGPAWVWNPALRLHPCGLDLALAAILRGT